MIRRWMTHSVVVCLKAGQLVPAFFCWSLAASLFLLACGCGQREPDSSEILRLSRLRLSAGDYAEACTLVDRISPSSKEWTEGQIVAGDAQMRSGDYAGSLAIWDRLLSSNPVAPGRYWLFAGQCHRELGSLAEAVACFEAVLKLEADNPNALRNLAFLYSCSGRGWDAAGLFERLLRIGEAGMEELSLLADPERPVEQLGFLEDCSLRCPSDPVVRRGLAIDRFRQGHVSQARQMLQELIREFPSDSDAQAALGELLVDAGPADFQHWFDSLDESHLKHPGIWYDFGLKARRAGNLEVAFDAFQKCVSIAPTHRRAFYQLSQLSSALGRNSDGKLSAYAADLLKLSEAIDAVLRTDGDASERVQHVCEILERTGRIWEACGWALMVARKSTGDIWAQKLLLRHREKLDDEFPLVDAQQMPPGLSSDPSRELVRAFADLLGAENHNRATIESFGPPRFDASLIDLPFEYLNGDDPSTPGVRMFEQTGGGVSVIDVDHDGRPDLFFTQGGISGGENQPYSCAGASDVVFLNRQSAFVRATDALPADRGFGQGAAAGDFDNDGFADLYVGNLEANQLLKNMGDGTFLDLSPDSQLPDQLQWTASTSIADLNSDGCPDLFDANYLMGDGILSAICGGKACSPSVFSAAPDFAGWGDGSGGFRFSRVSEASKSLGVLVFREPSHGSRTNVFVSNDQVANVLLQFEPSQSENAPAFWESALQGGVAFNEDGLSMGCMGIAADDVDGNGLLDLFVTNFHNEPNTLYLQDTAGLFVDRTRSFDLYEPAFLSVGWGTQFLDADRDGLSDLVITNGHVDDYRSENGEYHMLPLFFHSLGQEGFRKLPVDVAGPFFGERFLGRGLARLDWNQDGAVDFVVSNIRQPPSVVTNITSHSGHYLNVRLHGTKSSRDAVGAVVKIETPAGPFTKQLTAGDGFMATNERVLQFGLGADTVVRRLVVDWPSGQSTEIENPDVDTTIDLVEGR
ncbi:MAG: VCBS repeat-containing protein [Planctomycetaceae bacterium]|nr:VCBS repeat-containing protein [Planctomycetaceae bacterium]